MKACAIPCSAGYLWMAGLAGFILAVAVIAVLREIEHHRGPPN